jgi:hypothetical protein
MNILHVIRVFHGSIDWVWAFVRGFRTALSAGCGYRKLRIENAEVPSIREILVLPR